MSIACQLSFVRSTLPEDVTLVAVSKTHPVEAIREAYDAGHRVFGESRPQELREKYEALPQDIEWHMIGHLQTNKIKYIAGRSGSLCGMSARRPSPGCPMSASAA